MFESTWVMKVYRRNATAVYRRAAQGRNNSQTMLRKYLPDKQFAQRTRQRDFLEKSLLPLQHSAAETVPLQENLLAFAKRT